MSMNDFRLKGELHKVVREINTHGGTYVFKRNKKDEYGEPTGEETISSVRGLFHIEKGHLTKSISDGTYTHSKGSPMLMVEHDELSEIRIGCYTEINGKRYNVTGVNNIFEYNIVDDISLEEALNGNQI